MKKLDYSFIDKPDTLDYSFIDTPEIKPEAQDLPPIQESQDPGILDTVTDTINKIPKYATGVVEGVSSAIENRREIANKIASSLGSAQVGMASALKQGITSVNDFFGYKGEDALAEALGNYVDNNSAPQSERLDKAIKQLGEAESKQKISPEGEFFRTAATSALETSGSMLAGGIAKSALTGVAVMGPQVFGQEYDTLKKEGQGEQGAVVHGAAKTAIELVSEFLPLKKLLNMPDSIVRKIADMTVVEGGTEAASSIANSVYDRFVLDKNVDWDKALADATEAFKLGAAAGTMIGTAASAPQAASTVAKGVINTGKSIVDKLTPTPSQQVEPTISPDPAAIDPLAVAPGSIDQEIIDQDSATPELFTPTHKAGGGQDVQVVTKAGKIVPDTYMNEGGEVFRDANAVQIEGVDSDLSMNVNAVAGEIKNEVFSKTTKEVAPEPIPDAPLPEIQPTAEIPAVQTTPEIQPVAQENQKVIDAIVAKEAAIEPVAEAAPIQEKIAIPAEKVATKVQVTPYIKQKEPEKTTTKDESVPRETIKPVGSKPGIESPEFPESINAGPMTAKITPISKDSTKKLYRESDPDSLYEVILANRNGDSTNIFVSDDQALAIGQGVNTGATIEMKGDYVSGVEHKKPGTGIIGGKEYTANFISKNAISKITIKADKPITKGITKRLLSQYFTKNTLENGDVEYIPKKYEKLPIKPKGKESVVVTSQGKKVKTKYEIVDSNNLIASNDSVGNKNKDFPTELQPRDRSRGASQLQIKKIANNINPELLGESVKASDGAPIIGSDGIIESGNGRVLGIRGAYSANKAESYKQYLIDNAESYGLSKDVIEKTPNPVLVRVRQGELSMKDRAEFARQANQPDIAPLSATEQAKSDADRITDDDMKMYNPSEGGNTLSGSNQGFLQNFAKSIGDLETGKLSTSDGRWTKQMADRVQAAVFYKAYKDERLLNLVAEEADPDIKNIINALNKAAPAFARARSIDKNLGELDMASNIVDAADLIRKAKNNGVSLQHEVSQIGMFDSVDPTVVSIAEFIDSNSRSPKRLGIAFTEMAKFIETELLNKNQESLFDSKEATKGDVLKAADTKIKQEYGDDGKTKELFSKTKPKPEADSSRSESREQGKDTGTETKISEKTFEENVNGNLDEKTVDRILYSQTGEFVQRDTVENKPFKKKIRLDSLKQLIKIMQKENPGTRFVTFHVKETQDEAFGKGSEEKYGTIKGGFYAGTDEIVLISENIEDINDAITVIRHETVGHYGLREMLNKDGQYDKLLNRVYKSKDNELKELYSWVAQHYPELVENNDIRSIADEMLARAAETKTENTFLNKIYDQIIKLLNSIGLVKGSISNKEVFSLIRLSEESLRRPTLRSYRNYKNTTSAGTSKASVRGKFSKTIKDKSPPIIGDKNNDANDAPIDGNLGLPDEKLKDKFVRYAQDAFSRVKTLQKTIEERGGKVTPAGDVYKAEERSSGKITYRLDKLEKDYMKPLLKLMKDSDISLEDLDSYVIAKHAKERNSYIAEINDDMPDGGSGITNSEAKEILTSFADKKADLEKASNLIYKMNNESLDNLVEGGHMKQDEADLLSDRWEYYVPLKGKDGVEDKGGFGQGFSISGTGLKSAFGRGAGNIAESPVSHSFAQAESVIVRTEKSRVGQSLVELIRNNPDPEFWSISSRIYSQFEDLYGDPFYGYKDAPEGLIENIDYHRVKVITQAERQLAKEEGRSPVKKVVFVLDNNYKNRDDIFSVMVKGEELLIKIEDRVLLEQLKKMNITQLNAIVRGVGVVNRYLAIINTGLNPEFVITNFERDIQTAMINLSGEQSAKVAIKVAKAVPGAVRGIWQSTFDTKGKSEWREIYDEMRKEGGAIGFFGLEDIDTKVKSINRKLNPKKGLLGGTKKAIFNIRDVILDANLSVENATRLAAYKVVRDELISNGMSKANARAKAASVSKNLTVNFNRKGEAAPLLNTMYLFYNASIQGSARIITALENKRVQKIVSGIAATSFALAVFNRNIGGDDEDGIPYWDKISDYTKQTNLIIMHPDGSGDYTPIRLPYGYNVFFYAGTAMHDLIYDDRKKASTTAFNMLSALMNAFNPIQGADFLDTITPTFLKPFEQDARNINFMNKPLTPENPFDNYDRPESQKAFKSTNTTLKEFMSFLNEINIGGIVKGGNETHSGLIDMSPEIVKHYTGWLAGSAGTFVSKTTGVAANIINDEETDVKDIPIVRKFVGKQGSYFDTERFYSAVKGVNAVEKQLSIYKGTDKYSDYLEENRAVHNLKLQVKRYNKKLKRLRKQRDDAYNEDDKDFAKEKSEEIRQVMMKFSIMYDNAIEDK